MLKAASCSPTRLPTLRNSGPREFYDMATLTGAVSIALGDVNTAVIGTNQKLIDEIIGAGKEVGEKFWQLPLDQV